MPHILAAKSLVPTMQRSKFSKSLQFQTSMVIPYINEWVFNYLILWSLSWTFYCLIFNYTELRNEKENAKVVNPLMELSQ